MASKKPARPRRTRPRGDRTRARIVDAATRAFAERGFEGTSTRYVASLAGESQGLVTHHFRTKEELWRAAVDRVYQGLDRTLVEAMLEAQGLDPEQRIRFFLRTFVRHAARWPEQMQIMMHEGNRESPRLDWLVDHHLRGFFDLFAALYREAVELGLVPGGVPPVHACFVLIGAASTIFTAAPEVRRLGGIDAHAEETVEAHADALLTLFLRTPMAAGSGSSKPAG